MFAFPENQNNLFNLFQPQNNRNTYNTSRNNNRTRNNFQRSNRNQNLNTPNQNLNGFFQNQNRGGNRQIPQFNIFDNFFGMNNNNNNRRNPQNQNNRENPQNQNNSNFNIFQNLFNFENRGNNNKNMKNDKNKKIKKDIILDNSKEEQYFLQGEKLRYNNKYEEALKFYDKSIFLKKNSKYFHKKSLSLIKLQKNDLAEESILQAILLNPNKSEFYQVLGFLLIQKGKIEEALENFYFALNLKKDDINTKNYWNTKKVIYLIKEQKEKKRKNKLKNYLQKENLYNKKYIKLENSQKEIPDYYSCCINLDLITNPLQTPIGNSYEKEELLKSLNSAKEIKDPISGVKFGVIDQCVENKVLKKCIDKYVKAHPYAFDSFGPEDFKDIEFLIDFK